jgi:hypothetical protein
LNKTVPVVAVGDKQNDIGLDTVDETTSTQAYW